jgi:hypothetical protein
VPAGVAVVVVAAEVLAVAVAVLAAVPEVVGLRRAAELLQLQSRLRTWLTWATE